jgi:hypothetical protein
LGSKLEWPMRIESIEGARRLQFGHKRNGWRHRHQRRCTDCGRGT